VEGISGLCHQCHKLLSAAGRQMHHRAYEQSSLPRTGTARFEPPPISPRTVNLISVSIQEPTELWVFVGFVYLLPTTEI
jgi:hypothetical protein